MENRALEKENNGFTLLEVLVAVIILALVAVPLLRSFVSAYHVNARSRETMRATTLAQNEMEIFEREKLEVLLEYANAGEGGGEEADPADPTDPQDQRRQEWYGDYTVVSDPPYTTTFKDETTNEEWVQEHTGYLFKKTGVINDESGRDNFDVYVTLDPAAKESTDLYYNENTTPLLFMNTLSGADSASYVQRVNQGDILGDDETVNQKYEQRNSAYPEGTPKTENDFAKMLERVITLKIEQVNDGGRTITVAKVNYRYECKNADCVKEGDEVYTLGDQVIFNNAQSLDENGDPLPLQSMYLFYAPRLYTEGGVTKIAQDSAYGDPSYGIKSRIVVENKDKVPLNIYIVRQNVPDYSKNLIGVYTDELTAQKYYMEDYETNTGSIYTADIEIYEGIEDGHTYGKYFTNLDLESKTTESNGNANVTLHDVDNPGMLYNNKDTILEMTGFRRLDDREPTDRIYAMTVRVYPSGSDALPDDDGDGIPDTEPLVELTGTKVE